MEMNKKIVILTGATSGIGKETAKALSREGMSLVLPVRDLSKGEALRKEIIQLTGNSKVDLIECDLASLDSIRNFVKEFNDKYDRLDILINNAGVWETKRRESKDGHELTWAVNHLAPFLLTNLLLDKLKTSAPSRIITVSSEAHRSARIKFTDIEGKKKWGLMRSYAQSKLANIFFTRYLARQLEGTGVVANSLHPGMVSTNLFKKMPSLIQKIISKAMLSPEEGAETTIYLATSKEAQKVNGGYFARKKLRKASCYVNNRKVEEKLWVLSMHYTGL